MNKDVARLKRLLQAGIASASVLTFIACGGYGSLPSSQSNPSASGGADVSGNNPSANMTFEEFLANGYLAPVCAVDAGAGYAHCDGFRLTTGGAQAVAGNRTTASAMRSTLAGPVPFGFSPADYQAAYGLTAASATMGAGKTVAIVLAGHEAPLESDIGVYRQHYGLPPCTKANGCLKEFDQIGGTNYPTTDPWAQEATIDTEMVSAICPKCNIWVVEANSISLADLSIAENTAAALGPNAISNSWGGSESGMGKYASAFNHPGIPITAAAGTGPSFNEGFSAVQEIPAAFSTVIAVGGTALTQTGTSSVVTQWNDKSGNGNTLSPTTATFSNLPPMQPPLLNRAALNGLNTINMATLGQGLATLSNIGVVGGADRTLITLQYNNVINTGTDSTSEAFGIAYGASASIAIPFQWANDNFLASSASLYNAWNINVAERSSGSTSGYANGSQVGNTITNAINTVPQPMSIGTVIPGSGNQITGQFAEIMYYGSALSLVNRQKVEGYLACKWGRQSTLPISHPYRSSCPTGFTPTSLANLAVWYDASDATTITTRTYASGWVNSLWAPVISGCSTLVAKPSWQHDAGCSMRTVSDVSFDMTEMSVYSSIIGWDWWTLYGNSNSPPAIAAIAAMSGTRANDASFLYTPTGLANLNDVTLALSLPNQDGIQNTDGTCVAPGDWSTGVMNFSYLRRTKSGGGLPAYLCSAVTGYDAPTGNGTPNGVGAFTAVSCPGSGGTPNPHPTENPKGAGACGSS